MHSTELSPPAGNACCQFCGVDDLDFKFYPEDGDVFYDGSCAYPTDQFAARASFAAVQIREDGSPAKYLLGAVPASLRQSSTIIEHCALASLS